MEKCLKWKNRGNTQALRGRAERAMNFPPTVQTGREALCVAVELSQTPFKQLKPLNTCTSNQNLSESQTAKMSATASGADLVGRGPLKLHIILVFIIFSYRAKALTQGLFVSVCLLCPSTPLTAPTLLSSLLNAFGAGFPLLLKNTSVSMAPFFLWACPFGSALARKGYWLGETCAALMKICVSLSSKGHSVQTHSSFSSSYPVWNHLGMTEYKYFQIDCDCVPVGVRAWLPLLPFCGWMDSN